MIYRAHFVLPMSGDPIENGEVLVRNGIIEAIGTTISEAMPDEPVEDLGHSAILPGLVNLHSHLDYTIARGIVGDEPFVPWLQEIKQIGGKLDYSDFLASSRMGALQMVRSGVTAISDSSYSGAVVQAAKEAGLRGIIYQETFGADPSGDYQEQVDRLYQKVHELERAAGDRLTVGISPHSVYTSSERLLRLVADLARDEGLPIALHVAETRDEVVLIESAEGHIADLWRLFRFDFDARGMTPVEYLHEIGILGPKTVAAHCVHLNQSDIDTLAEEETRVAHCPKSNAKLSVGTAQLGAIIGSGIITGIGTDSAASSDSLDMFEEMRFAVLMQRAAHSDVKVLDAKRVLELATLGGATSMGLEQEIGSLEEGKRADIIAVDLSKPSAFPCPDPYSAVVYCCSAADVVFNMIDGEIIYRSGEFKRVDAKEIALQASLSATKL